MTYTNGNSADPAGERHSEEAEPDLRELAARAFDIVRYAPVSMLLDGPSMLPKLAEQGKVHVANARMLGKLFMRHSGNELRKRLEESGGQVADLLRMAGVVDDGSTPPWESGAQQSSAPAAEVTTPIETESEPQNCPAVDELAIPEYDSLSASHVVNRLPSLSDEELEAVRTYEAAHRGRKTILNKVAQLAS